MRKNLFNKVWDLHKVGTLPTGQDQLFIGLHLIHEVTSPQAFGMLKDKKLTVKFPERTVATVDHIIPTDNRTRPLEDPLAEKMLQAIEDNTKKNHIKFFGPESDKQGIVHIVGPELGLTQPGMTIACGDSHTSTHGAFGAIAFGIGTSQIRDILATQTMALNRPKVRKIVINGTLKQGVTAKDVVLKLMAELGVNGGIGFAYEYAGTLIESLSMEERLTICNMSIEGGARAGYINPDQTTFDYLKGRESSPKGADWDKSVDYWKSIASDQDAEYDDIYNLDISNLEPMVTWGITPGQAIGVTQQIPMPSDLSPAQQEVAEKACEHMSFKAGEHISGKKIDVVFFGSCTNGRTSDFRAAASILKGKKVSQSIRAFAVPGSKQVDREAKAEGLDQIFVEAGIEWREPGCSMCLAMNPDKLHGKELSVSTSNRNFIGRQGSPVGRTLLASPLTAAASALTGVVTDVRTLLGKGHASWTQ